MRRTCSKNEEDAQEEIAEEGSRTGLVFGLLLVKGLVSTYNLDFLAFSDLGTVVHGLSHDSRPLVARTNAIEAREGLILGATAVREETRAPRIYFTRVADNQYQHQG